MTSRDVRTDAQRDPLLYLAAPSAILWAIVRYGALPERYTSDMPSESLRLPGGRRLRQLPKDAPEPLTVFTFSRRSPYLLLDLLREGSEELCIITARRSLAEAGNWLVVPTQPLDGRRWPRARPYREALGEIDWPGMQRPPDFDDPRWLAAAQARVLVPDAIPWAQLEAIHFASDAARTRQGAELPRSARVKLQTTSAWFD